ncbi:kinesin-like protein KIF18A [Liolophura sinensis]|uniref:kinesin-like protein KIF18A n=1 Tax=Liolophura sinensis TaxID=3198878 RepID=UPI0031586C4C
MGSKNIRVVVRVRPENAVESSGNSRTVVQPMDERVLVFDPKEETPEHFFHGKIVRRRDITKRPNRDLKFAFDYVFASHNTNKDVFEQTTRSVLEGVLDGYNSAVFAYGATGAGKTHTMLGKPTDPGVTFLTVMELYHRINTLKSEKTIEVAVSYLEVYNEQIRDLLLPKGTLPIREDGQHGVVVQGLSLHKPRNAEELMHMLDVGNQNRTQHPTDANSESSRSHAVFQVFVRQKDRTANITAQVKMAKLSLIDLAGSERATMTKNMGMRFREGANINRSLLALGNVINALADDKVKTHHIPYRNSKLTRLLKDSLGGNCQTVMIAAVSPSSLSYEDTYNTLKYADRAKHIKAELTKNVLQVDLHVSRYAQIVKELRKEISELKEKLSAAGTSSGVSPLVPVSCPKTNSFQDKLCQIFTTRVNIRKELLEYESSSREIHWKVLCKNRKLSRLSVIDSIDGTHLPIVEKIKKSVQSSQRRMVTLNHRRESVMSRMTHNVDELKQLEKEMKCSESGSVPQVLAQKLKMHHLEVEVTDYRRCNKYLESMIRSQEKEARLNDRLIGGLLQMVRKQYFVLKGHGLLTSDVSEDFIGLKQLIDGAQEVRWADQNSSPQKRSPLLSFPVLSTSTHQSPVTPSSKSGKGLNTSYSPSPHCVKASSKEASVTSPSIGDSARSQHLTIARLSGDLGKQPEVSPPVVTQFAGRTPSAKHFVTVHGARSESPAEDEGLEEKQQDLNLTYVCDNPSANTPVRRAEIETVSVADKGRVDIVVNPELQHVINPATQTKVRVNTATVTKAKPSVDGENSGCVQAKRAMSFDTTPPTPRVNQTFADAVKSPGRPPLRAITDNCMSPLAIPLDTPKYDKQKRIASSDSENITKPGSAKTKTSALRRVGLPSLFSQTPDPKYQARRVNPRYMQMTKAMANKRSGRTKTLTDFDENRLTARREKIDLPQHNFLRFRSKSVNCLKS